MVDRDYQVEYRPFEDSDFDALADILQKLWHEDHDSEEYNHLEACEDLTGSLMRSTCGVVAVLDGEPVGTMLAHAGEEDPVWIAHWTSENESYRQRMREMDPVSFDDHIRFLGLEGRVNDGMAEEAGLTGAARFVLLIAREDVRGHGIGRGLFERAAQRMGELGETRAYLSTDTCSNWQLYEHLGLKRVAIYYAKPDEQDVLADEMYLYQLDF